MNGPRRLVKSYMTMVGSALRNTTDIRHQQLYNSMALLMEMWHSDHGGNVDLRLSEARLFSQNGEDGIVAALVRGLGGVPESFVEFGANDGGQCNTRFAAEVLGWTGTYFEPSVGPFQRLTERYRGNPRVVLGNDAVTPENVVRLFRESSIPDDLGILSIDIDGQDFWVWEALADHYHPAIVVVEYNASIERNRLVVERKGWPWNGDFACFGSSLSAFEKLGAIKGYTLLHTDATAVNAFFVRTDILGSCKTQFRGLTHRSPNYHLEGRGHAYSSDNERQHVLETSMIEGATEARR